jgi:hypothetical protein
MKITKITTILMFFALSMFLFSCEGDVAETDAEIIENISTKWTVVETGGTTYDVTISAGSGSNEIKIYNFNSYGNSIAAVATVSGLNITIKNQTLNTETVYGSGTIAGDYSSISLTYSVDDTGGVENVSASLTKYAAPLKTPEKAEEVQ